jgi:glucosamine--fructose-6-phosphate aminotransferase (isomerizing)
MCGIIGIIGKNEVAPLLIEGLRRLEYRGYDSAGVATLVNGRIDRRRAEGKLVNLDRRVQEQPLAGTIGIGHTRWATHGGPTETNAHPHATRKVAVVHNGIIENYQDLKAELEGHDHLFETETDTEIIVHLVTYYLDRGLGPVEATAEALKRLEGAFSLALIFAGEHDLMIGARRGTPLAVGYGNGNGEMYLASDAFALAPLTNRLTYLEDGDWVVLNQGNVVIRNAAGEQVERPIKLSAVSGAMIGKGEHRHFMLKEIYEQPQVIGDTLNAFVQATTGHITLPDLPFDLAAIPRVTVVACGTAFYAGMVAKYWLEQIARVPVELDIASEFRYREAPMPEGGLALFISQSGETLDTLEALRYAKRQGQHIMSVINVAESTISRESDVVLSTLAGPEIGVASTKAFTTQLTVLACFAVAVARARGTISREQEAEMSTALREVPARAVDVLNHDERLRQLAHDVSEARDALYLGRGTSYPIALEGALKLKEISYIHAEGYAAGEMKHGPIALIDENVPIIALAPNDALFEKTASNIMEAAARGGKVLLLSDAKGIERMGSKVTWTVTLPEVHAFVAPILYAIPMQLLAYHTAVIKGTDVDQPRNLAKSVTVE